MKMKKETDAATIRRLAVVLKDSHDAITVQDLQGNITLWNRGAEKMYGYTETEALQMNVSQIVPKNNKLESLEYLELIASGEIVESFEAQRISKDGKILDIWLVITCLTNDFGSVVAIATTERDITEIKNELRRKEKEVKMLKGLLPICALCKKIKDGDGNWQPIESYIQEHSEAEIDHAICPECVEMVYPKKR